MAWPLTKVVARWRDALMVERKKEKMGRKEKECGEKEKEESSHNPQISSHCSRWNESRKWRWSLITIIVIIVIGAWKVRAKKDFWKKKKEKKKKEIFQHPSSSPPPCTMATLSSRFSTFWNHPAGLIILFLFFFFLKISILILFLFSFSYPSRSQDHSLLGSHHEMGSLSLSLSLLIHFFKSFLNHF